MTQSFTQLVGAINNSLGQLRTQQPDLMRGFGALARAAMHDGSVSRKHKELTALALGVAGHCDACIGFHMQTLLSLGATREEVEEILGVAVYMGGGPSLMYAANALAAFEELSQTSVVAAA
jgi:AhpD family alkylhydroperoxidase